MNFYLFIPMSLYDIGKALRKELLTVVFLSAFTQNLYHNKCSALSMQMASMVYLFF